MGVSTRKYEGVVESVREGFGFQRSSVSRHFVKTTAKQFEELSARRFGGRRSVVIFIDGLEFAGETLVCALGLGDDGTKQVLSLRQEATENKELVTSLLSELAERGLGAIDATVGSHLTAMIYLAMPAICHADTADTSFTPCSETSNKFAPSSNAIATHERSSRSESAF